MKKIKYITLFLLSFCSITILSQNISGTAIYKKQIYNAYLKKDQEESKRSKFIKMIKENLNRVEYQLIFNNNEAVFKVENILDLENDRQLKLAVNLGGGRGVFYNNIKTKERIQQAEGFGERFLITDSIKSNDWILINEEKIILGYKCYKAIYKRNKYEAWYTSEIPANFGPLGYASLPGLIIELKLTNGYRFILKKIAIRKLSNRMIIKKPYKGKKTTRKEFNNLSKKIIDKRKF